MYPKIIKLTEGCFPDQMSDERKAVLQPLIHYVQSKVSSNQTIRLHFICTHNSRRSHLAQIWAQTFAYYFGIRNVYCYSGGTESTSLAQPVIHVLEHQGFEVIKLSGGVNPVYGIKFGQNDMPVICFSKAYNHPLNPGKDFCAILTCDQADEACPVVLGAESRISIKYLDPKVFDGTDDETQKYKETSMQIALEMWYVFHSIRDHV